MAKLHTHLESLQPRDFSDIPLDNLSDFLKEAFEAAETIINSIPHPPETKDDSPSSYSTKATSAAEVKPSAARLHTVHPEHEALRGGWGKPIKLSASQNPSGLTLFKMAANDRNGAWFGRRSVHEGLSFDRWKTAMQSEFAESLAVSGGPGAGSIRGIGADKLLERKKVEGVGKLEVYLLSAQFPGPTAPRDFVTCLLTTDSGLTEKSRAHEGDQKVGEQTPRHYMVISIPVEHPDAPPRSGLVRGRYESVEMIREVIPHLTSQSNDTGSSSEDISYPVEWSMITRSDPGGGIPRFMVERGTPGSIAGDAPKFLDWATGKDDFIKDDEISEVEPSEKVDRLVTPVVSRKLSNSATFEPSQPNDTGIISSLTNVVKDGIANYVPDSVQNGIASVMPEALRSNEELQDDDESTETDSLNSWASAEQYATANDAMPPYMKHSRGESSSTASIVSEAGSEKEKSASDKLERQLTKLEAKRKELDAKYAKTFQKETEKANEHLSKDKKEEAKIRQRLEKEKAKQEERYNHELKKLEHKKQREERKAEERRKKVADGDALSRMTKDRDQARKMAEVLRLENDIWKQRVGDLQKENTMLVARISRFEGGQGIIKDIRNAIQGDDLKRVTSPAAGSSQTTSSSS